MNKHLGKAGYKNVQMGSNPAPKQATPPAPVPGPKYNKTAAGGKLPSVPSKPNKT